ncbi:hypothetical protein HK405_010982, partial [Cladochytrium tenue]
TDADQEKGFAAPDEATGLATGGDGGSVALLSGVTGQVFPGQMLAVMGPSGAGKTTFLDVVARRRLRGATGKVFLGASDISTTEQMATVASYVEQEDGLLSTLTVFETVMYAARLSNPKEPVRVQRERVTYILEAMGLSKCANVYIGNPLQKGISGGQKRRVTIAQSLVTFPRVLFLDEPTSGLDTTTSREVMSAIRRIAVEKNMIVVATIHQPNFETLSLFSSLLLLAEGQVMFNGPIDSMAEYFEAFGAPIPRFFNPADHAIDLVNSDFELNSKSNVKQTVAMLSQFARERYAAEHDIIRSAFHEAVTQPLAHNRSKHRSYFFQHTVILSHRILLTYCRNLIAYGVRIGMYIGMGLMMALIWVRLGNASSTVNDRLSVHFFSVAFLSFMSVAGIPAFLEEREVFVREKHNGLYKAGPYALANTLVNIPFMLLCAILFGVISYYSIGLNPNGGVFVKFIAFLFLAVYAAESQVILVASLLPIFVAALAIASFMNGFWMSVQGYFIKAISLPKFWRYSFHYMDYQKYAFELLVNNDFTGLTFDCGRNADGTCAQCAYPSSDTNGDCVLYGPDVLDYLQISHISYTNWVVILLAIIIVYRLAWYITLVRSK